MVDSQLTLDEQLSALKLEALDEFSRLAMDGARHALADTANPLRLNFFSTAMRILYDHMMNTLAPIKEVTQSQWFVAEKIDGTPTRGQLSVFAIQGGLGDAFVKDVLSVDVAPLRKRLVGAVDDLNKHIHGREDTICLDEAEQDVAARATAEAFGHFLEVYHDCRSIVDSRSSYH